ncbi:MAG: FkbM family methyltransferase [Betaproteobacteria bacterium]|nr:FkbM family methyltransferase [Betaproteobacteria bacterium]
MNLVDLREKGSSRLKFFKSKVRSWWLKLLGPRACGVFVETDWGFMLLDPRDAHVSRQLLRTGAYNREEVSFLGNFLKPSDGMLIVGGHIGALAIPLGKSVKSLDVVEANPESFKLLEANVSLSRLTNLSVWNWAAANEEGALDFLVSSENSGGSKRLPVRGATKYMYDKPKILTVSCRRLDDAFPQDFDVILMDIEGSEYAAMRGAQRLLQNCRVFVFEFIPDHLRNVAGVDFEDFFEALPVKDFDRALLPRHAKDIPISQLRGVLQELYVQNEYEDGVLMLKERLTS